MLELRNAGRLAGVGAFGVSARSSSGSPCPWLMLGREHLNLDLANWLLFSLLEPKFRIRVRFAAEN